MTFGGVCADFTALQDFIIMLLFTHLTNFIKSASFHLDTAPIIFLLIVRPCYKHEPHGDTIEEKSEDLQ